MNPWIKKLTQPVTELSRTACLLAGLCLLSPFDSHAEAPLINVPRLSASEVSVDGKLDEAVWQKATVVEMNNITFPEENQPSAVFTKALLFEDGDTFYLGFVANDPDPEKIRAFLRDRDSNNIWNDDLIGVKLDTYGDHKQAYQFWVNPMGVQVDSIENVVTNQESNAWDAIWDAAGQVTDEGYVVEMALPLRILNFNEREGLQDWAIELVRFYPRETRQRLSNMIIDPSNACKVCQMGPLKGFANAKQGQNLAVVPSVTVGAGRTRDIWSTPQGDWSSDTNTDVGLDVKWGITPDISLNATVNPDFSQIEADAAQLSINNTFSLFFQEKRAFFLDNIDYFSTPMNLLYTRNISDPDYGAKLTGRMEEHSFGVFAANDTSTTVFVPGNLGSDLAFIDSDSDNAVLRYRYDPDKDLSMGWIGTFRSAEGYHNDVNGFDVKYRFSDQDNIVAQFVHSDTEYPVDLYKDFFSETDNAECTIENCAFDESTLRTKKDGAFSDTAWTVRYNHEERDWDFRVSYMEVGDDFRADMGFFTQTDWNKLVIGANRYWRAEPNQWWSRFRFGGDWDITHNDNGEVLERESQLWMDLDATSQSTVFFSITDRVRAGDRVRPWEIDITGNAPLFTETQFDSFWGIQLADNLNIGMSLDWGDEIDFANNRLGESFFWRPTVTWKPHQTHHPALPADLQKTRSRRR